MSPTFIRKTLRLWRWISFAPMYTTHLMPNKAQAVAMATPCCPAPVSAISRSLPKRLASKTWANQKVSERYQWKPKNSAHSLVRQTRDQRDLANGIVNLVGAGVGQVFALEPDLGAAALGCQSLAQPQGRGAANVVPAEPVQLCPEARIRPRLLPGDVQLLVGFHQRFLQS